MVAPDDNHMLNDVYSEDELPDFRLGARPCAPRRAAAAAIASFQDDEPTDPAKLAMPLAASTVPKDRIQQLFDKVDVLSQQQQ